MLSLFFLTLIQSNWKTCLLISILQKELVDGFDFLCVKICHGKNVEILLLAGSDHNLTNVKLWVKCPKLQTNL